MFFQIPEARIRSLSQIHSAPLLKPDTTIDTYIYRFNLLSKKRCKKENKKKKNKKKKRRHCYLQL